MDKKLVREVKSDNKDCEIEIPKDGFHTVEVTAFSGGSWFTSENSVQFNRYVSCDIDKELSQIKESQVAGKESSMQCVELSLKIAGAIPGNAVAFLYTVRTKPESAKNAPGRMQKALRQPTT